MSLKAQPDKPSIYKVNHNALINNDDDMDETEDLIICGYIRDILGNNNDYSFLLSIIKAYRKQGYAKYYQESKNNDYKDKMRFGDIINKDSDTYYAMSLNNKLQEIGSCNVMPTFWGNDNSMVLINLRIPISISQYLINTISFYSQIPKYELFNTGNDELYGCSISYNVTYNDTWIIKHFGGALSNEYQSITVKFSNGKFKHVRIYYTKDFKYDFDPINHEISYKDVDMFYKLRKDKTNLIKIRASLYGPSRWNESEKLCDKSSVLWEVSTYFIAAELDHVNYIGPKSEKNEMMNKLNEFYSERTDVVIRLVQDEED